MARRSMPPVIPLLVGLLAIAVAATLLLFVWDGWSAQRRAATVFVRTPGTVLAVHIEETRARRKTRAHWSVEIEYQYDVAGRRYTGDREYFLGSRFDSETGAHAYADAHPVGSAIDVFFDPEDPTQCVLDNSAPSSWPLAFPLAPFAFGLLCIWIHRRLASTRANGKLAEAGTPQRGR